LRKIPTGDGMALIFFESPEQPVECARRNRLRFTALSRVTKCPQKKCAMSAIFSCELKIANNLPRVTG